MAYCNIVPYYIIAIQKLHERLATLTKASGPDIEKEKWKKVLFPDVISSEESDIEDEGVIIIKLLVWCSQRVSGISMMQDNSKRVGKHGGNKCYWDLSINMCHARWSSQVGSSLTFNFFLLLIINLIVLYIDISSIFPWYWYVYCRITCWNSCVYLAWFPAEMLTINYRIPCWNANYQL